MSNRSDAQRFPLPDNLTQDFAIPYAYNSTAIAVGIGDACYFKGQVATYGDVAYPADQMASLGTESLDQFQFAQLFCGYSQEQILPGETNLFKRFVVRASGVADVNCPSQVWKHGDLVGIYSNGATLDPQQVDKVTQPGAAIGLCVKDSVNATTRVRIGFNSRLADQVINSIQYGGLGDGQTISAGTVLTDANQTFTVATPTFTVQTNTGARTITLPKETTSARLVFIVANLAGSSGTITFLGSAGGNALGNNVLPAGKTGWVFCDGLSWYCVISA